MNSPTAIIVDESQLNGSLKDLIKIRRHFINLIILTYIWLASSFNLYLLHYNTKKLPGSFFANNLVSSVIDIPVTVFGGILYYLVGPRWSFTVTFACALIGGLFLLFLGADYPALVPYFLSLAKCGIKVTLDTCYLANAMLFPAIFAGTAFGICTVGAKLASTLSPMLAELEAPVPMIVFTSVSAVALLVSYFLRPERGM